MTSFDSGSFWQRSKSFLDDEILIKKLLLSHDPDGRHLDSEMLLCAVENIMFYATTSEMLCKCPGKGDLHTRTMALFDLLGNYGWAAKVALALAGFATSYGEFCLIMQLRPHISLAVSLADFKQLPSSISILKPQVKALRLLVKTMVDLTKCIIEFEGLPAVLVGPYIENLAAMKSEIYVTAYWIIRSTLACSSQITNLKAMKPEQVHVLTCHKS
ncbi:Sieve element occlusion [Theobroma cacao]|nr:Sieve element occlusion [Theobroma cacao]